MVYLALVRFKFGYVSIAWNFVIDTDSDKLEHAQRGSLLNIIMIIY